MCLLENTRFEPGDVANDPSLAASLASLCDAFVLDGFGVCHRAQASVSGVARALPASRRFPGPLVRRELHFLGAALDAPVRPFGVVLGGMKARIAARASYTRLIRRLHSRARTRATRAPCAACVCESGHFCDALAPQKPPTHFQPRI